MTNDPDIPKDASLLRCAIEKSWSVSKKIGLWLGGIAIALIACYAIYLGATSQTASTIWSDFTGFIALIPWELWAVIIGIGAIFGYSLVWCMARNLTDKDWQSETAKNIAVAFAFVAVAFAFALVVFAFAFVAVAVAAFAFAYVFANSKEFLFIGAYLHYRERIKNQIQNNEGEN